MRHEAPGTCLRAEDFANISSPSSHSHPFKEEGFVSGVRGGEGSGRLLEATSEMGLLRGLLGKVWAVSMRHGQGAKNGGDV